VLELTSRHSLDKLLYEIKKCTFNGEIVESIKHSKVLTSMQKHTINLREFLKIILEFLDTLHSQKILYCNLKPENIMAYTIDYGDSAIVSNIKFIDYSKAIFLNQQSGENE